MIVRPATATLQRNGSAISECSVEVSDLDGDEEVEVIDDEPVRTPAALDVGIGEIICFFFCFFFFVWCLYSYRGGGGFVFNP